MDTKKSLLSVLLLTACISGCSSINPQDAVALANNGQTVANATSLSYQQSRDGLNRYLESEAISTAFTERSDVGDETITAMLEISETLAARKAVFNKLSATYKTFGELASYDAAKEVENQINGLSGAINEYAKATKSAGNPISNVTNLIISKGGGLIASEAQKDQMKEASALIRIRLAALSPLLEKDIERLKRYKSREVTARTRATVALISEGLGDPSKMISNHLSTVGLSSEKDGVSYWSNEVRKAYITTLIKHRSDTKNPKPNLPPIYEAMQSYISVRIKTEIETQHAILEETKNAIDNLASMHTEFESGTPLSTSSLTQSIVLLQQLLIEFKAAKQQDEA
jgi:hypothetical protein